jgi:hypothetical protein
LLAPHCYISAVGLPPMRFVLNALVLLPVFLFVTCATRIPGMEDNPYSLAESDLPYIYGKISRNGFWAFSINLTRLGDKKTFTYEKDQLVDAVDETDNYFLFRIDPGDWEITSISRTISGKKLYKTFSLKFTAYEGKGYYVGVYRKSQVDAHMYDYFRNFDRDKTVNLDLESAMKWP